MKEVVAKYETRRIHISETIKRLRNILRRSVSMVMINYFSPTYIKSGKGL